jgi:hypothetical protein
VNSIGTSSYSDTVTGSPSYPLTITAQPKNDYATAANQNITFSVTTSGGGTPTYQWQYYGADYNNGDYEYRWRNFPSNATAASFVTKGNTMSDLLSFEFYETGTAKLRCVVTAEGGASTLTSDTVRFLELDYLHYPNTNWFGTQGTYPNYVHYTQPYTFSPQVGELPVLDFYDYAMGYADTSWYTGNDTTLKIQVATNGYTDSADWTDLHTQDFRGSVYLSGYTLPLSTGTKYYRAILINKWPYAVNNGTQSATRTPQHVYAYSNSSILQVTWPETASSSSSSSSSDSSSSSSSDSSSSSSSLSSSSSSSRSSSSSSSSSSGASTVASVWWKWQDTFDFLTTTNRNYSWWRDDSI